MEHLIRTIVFLCSMLMTLAAVRRMIVSIIDRSMDNVDQETTTADRASIIASLLAIVLWSMLYYLST